MNYQPIPYPPSGIDSSVKPNPATAIIAGVLAVLGAVMAVVSLFDDLAYLSVRDESWAYTELIINVLMVCSLGAGALLLFLRKPLGQWIVAAGCVLAFIRTVLSIMVLSDLTGDSAAAAVSKPVGAILGALPPIATILLVLLPLTSRYLSWEPGSGAPQQFAPQQPYGAQPGVAAYPQPYAHPPQPAGRPPLGIQPPNFQPQQRNRPTQQRYAAPPSQNYPPQNFPPRW
jgi:hypothetical protein